MPAVGSSATSTSGRGVIHFARTTFCWLPPERAAKGLAAEGGTTRHSAKTRAASVRSLRAEASAALERSRSAKLLPVSSVGNAASRRRSPGT
jgi:hypothetical protein